MNERRVPRRYPSDDDDGNIWRAIAGGLILMCMLAGLIIAIRFVVGVVVGR